MKISVTYNFPNGENHKGNSLEKDCAASICIEDVSVLHMKRVLAELSEMVVRDFARLGVLTAFKSDDDTVDAEVESMILRDCSGGSGIPDAVSYSGVQPLKNHPA